MPNITPPPDQNTPVDFDPGRGRGVFYAWHEWFTRLWRAVADLQTAVTAVTVDTSDLAHWTPYYIPEGETFTVPANKQVLFAIPITGPGAIVVHGILVQVN